MKKVFVNFTNHPVAFWEKEQIKQARVYGEIVDVPFPAVDPQQDEDYISKLVEESVQKILTYHPKVVLCQGEYCLVYGVVNRLKELNIPVLAACSKRCVKEQGNRKEVTFSFVRFRKY